MNNNNKDESNKNLSNDDKNNLRSNKDFNDVLNKLKNSLSQENSSATTNIPDASKKQTEEISR